MAHEEARRRVWRLAVRLLLALTVLVVLPVALVWWLDPAIRLSPGVLLWRNALPVALVAGLILALTARWGITALLTGGLALAVFRVNAVKELNMNEPLSPSDLVLGRQLMDNLGFFIRYLGHSVLPVLGAVVVLLGMAWLWRSERRTRVPAMPRLVILVVAMVGLVTLFHGDGPWRAAYSDKGMPGFPLWSPIEGVKRNGLMAGLVRLSHEARVSIPKANAAPVRRFAAKHAQALKERSQRPLPAELPDIVVVQSEAFFEPGLLNHIEFGDYAPNFARLSSQGISGELGTPAFGGGTIRTEFETLTGYPVQAFPSIVYPYYGLADDWMPSMPRRLGAMGYDTRFLHPFKASFWNRSQVMPLLGFMHTDYEDSFQGASRAGEYISDQALFERISEDLEKHRDKPQFIMAITMENHGPWGADVGELARILDGKPLPSGLSDEARTELTHYLAHLANGDQALGQLASRLLARDRWTVLLFYGDHLPVLPHAFPELGFDDGKTGPTHRTRYLLLSNRQVAPKALNITAHDLPGLVFDTVGLPEDGYLAIEAEVRQTLHQDPDADAPAYGQIVFNAARLAVHCQEKLTLEATCSSSQDR